MQSCWPAASTMFPFGLLNKSLAALKIVPWAAAETVAVPAEGPTTVVPEPVITICWFAPVPPEMKLFAPPQIETLLAAPALTVFAAGEAVQDLRCRCGVDAALDRVVLCPDHRLVAAA